MQHLDEGTIHTWLDGALTTEEAARVEQHVAECPQCASAVAEARGFIAASSRILTKLDDVPRGVLPAARPIRRRNVAAWRAAAAVLVVAVGSFVVLKNQSGKRGDAAESTSVANAPVMSAPAADVGLADSAQPQTPTALSKRSRPPAVAAAPLPAPPVPARAEQRQDRDQAAQAYAGGAAQSNAAVAPPSADAVTEAPLQLVREETVPGGKRSIYTVASSDTVTLFEPLPVDLQAVATAGAAPPAERRARSAPTANQLSAKAPAIVADTGAIVGTTAAATAQSARMRGVSPAAPPSPAPAPTQVRPIRTIRWTEGTSGRVLTLSGPLPVERLEEIKKRIERERAAAKKPAR